MLGMGISLVDLGDYPEIHADDVADYQEIGGRARFVMAAWYKIGGMWRPKITGLVTRRIATMTAAQITYWRGISKADGPVALIERSSMMH